MNSFLACTNCHEVVVKSVAGSEVKIRSKVLVVKADNTVMAVCKGCGEELRVPLKLDSDLAKSLANYSEPRLYLKK